MENILLTDPGYSQFCQLQPNTASSTAVDLCQPPLSVLSMFHGTPTPQDGFPDSSLSQEDINIVLGNMSRNLYSYGSFFDTGFSSVNLNSQWTRSIYSMGLPLHGFTAADTRHGFSVLMSFSSCTLQTVLIHAFNCMPCFLHSPLLHVLRQQVPAAGC